MDERREANQLKHCVATGRCLKINAKYVTVQGKEMYDVILKCLYMSNRSIVMSKQI